MSKEELIEENEKLNNNLNLLKTYFREYGLLKHYLLWIKHKAGEGEKPSFK